MALLTKKILPAKKYKVASNNGSRIDKDFDEAYLNRIATTSNKMLEAGLMIPASFKHHKDAKPRTKEEIEAFEKEIEVNKPADPLHNAGYWKAFMVAPDDKDPSKKALWGIVDAPGEVTEKDSMAWRLANVNKEVSASITDNFVDGQNRTWTDGLLHVAVVNHAVVDNQGEYIPNSTIVNMSMATDDNPDSSEEGTIAELVAALKNLKITLPTSTNSKTFLRDLLIATLQTNKSSSDDTLVPAPIYMSIEGDNMALTEAQAKSIVDAKSVNPATQKPFTMEDLGFVKKETPPVNLDLAATVEVLKKENESATALLKAMAGKLAKTVTATIESRIAALEAKGIPKDYIEKTLKPQVAYSLSINPVTKDLNDHPLEALLLALETAPMPARQDHSASGYQTEPNPFYGNSGTGDVADSKIDEMLDAMAKEDGVVF